MTLRKPTTSDTWVPNMIAERTSRPCSSVPRRCLVEPPSIQAGGRNASIKSSVATSLVLNGARIGAAIAATKKITVVTNASTVTGERRKL
jgi:hypothetical protein